MCASERHIPITFPDYSTFLTKYNPYFLLPSKIVIFFYKLGRYLTLFL